MPNKFSALSLSSAALALGLALTAGPAYAGFQWVSPNEGASTTYQPPVTSAYAAAPSAATSAPEIISPVVISGTAASSAQANTLSLPTPSARASAVEPPHSFEEREPSRPVSLIQAPESAPTGKADLSTATISVSPPATDTTSVANGIVKGFASQIPLALALRQILPVGYSFSIDQNVDMDTLVSYKGGKTWRETLRAMLIPAGLVSHEQGVVITVSRGASAATEARVETPAPAPVLQPAKPAMFLSMPSDVPASTIKPADGWSADRGETLRKVLTEWCRRAGVELHWQAEYDYPIEASAHFSSGFEDAVRNLLAGFDAARPQPIGELHSNPSAGQTVLVIQARGNSYSN